MTIQYFTASDGARIAYRDSGANAGRPLLCLSGLSRNGSDFDYLAPHLPPGWRMIRMDYRGRGASEWTGPDTYTVPREGRDAIELLDHLGLAQAAILGTSRGGLVAMMLAMLAPGRLSGICLNDVGPVIEHAALARIQDYLGRNPAARTHEDAARRLAASLPGFDGVPHARWLDEARRHYVQTGEGLRINYDPRLREAFAAAMTGPAVDLWALFDACAGLPLALVRGASSDLLTHATAAEMARRRPDMIAADVPGRGHIPFLDEPESLAVITAWLARIAAAPDQPSA